MTGGWKCGSPDAAHLLVVHGRGGLDALLDEGLELLDELLGAGADGEVHGSSSGHANGVSRPPGPYLPVGLVASEACLSRARALHAADLDPDPFVQFEVWFADATEHGQLQPEAMTVATTTVDGQPSARLVLLRGIDERGFTFFTNYQSRKGRELDANPHAAIAFHWPEVLRQIRAVGSVERVSAEDCDAYWFHRPRASRLSAWASEQSEVVGDRDEMEARVEELEQRFTGVDVPRPAWWGGYRVLPVEMEFWQHRDDRLHDRFRYQREAAERWRVTRLQP